MSKQSPLTVNVFYPYVIHINGEFCDGHHLHDVLLYMHRLIIHASVIYTCTIINQNELAYYHLPVFTDKH